MKASVFRGGEFGDHPSGVRRSVYPAEAEDTRAVLRRLLPDIDVPPRKSVVCLFTDTPDEDFLIDFHPDHSQVLISSPCSGHGFKFASVIGELQADLLAEGRIAST